MYSTDLKYVKVVHKRKINRIKVDKNRSKRLFEKFYWQFMNTEFCKLFEKFQQKCKK